MKNLKTLINYTASSTFVFFNNIKTLVLDINFSLVTTGIAMHVPFSGGHKHIGPPPPPVPLKYHVPLAKTNLPSRFSNYNILPPPKLGGGGGGGGGASNEELLAKSLDSEGLANLANLAGWCWYFD